MVLKICNFESCQFPMVADVHRYFRHMGNRSHCAEFAIRQVNLHFNFCFDHLDPVLLANLFVDKAFRGYCVNDSIDVDYFIVTM